MNKYKKGFTCSTFDLLHAGHIMMLEEAKSVCEHLTVGLQTDPTIDRPEKNKPIQSLFERRIQLEAVKYVDEIVIYDTEKCLENILLHRCFDVRILGDEYKGKSFTGDWIEELDIHYVNRGWHGFSSSELRKRIKND